MLDFGLIMGDSFEKFLKNAFVGFWTVLVLSRKWPGWWTFADSTNYLDAVIFGARLFLVVCGQKRECSSDAKGFAKILRVHT